MIENQLLVGALCGMGGTILLGGIVSWIVVDRRHRCGCCGARTKKTCRLKDLPTQPNTPPGHKPFLVYIFRVCQHDIRHVTVATKVLVMTREKASRKPRKEFIIGDLETRELFSNAKVGPDTNFHMVGIEPLVTA